MPSVPAIDDTLTMQPAPAAFRCGVQARTIWNMPSVLTPRMRWNVAASTASQLAAPANEVMPALLTSASTRPQRSTAARAIARHAASSLTSARTTSASAPASRQACAAACASASLRE
jgi:hypothetical protein